MLWKCFRTAVLCETLLVKYFFEFAIIVLNFMRKFKNYSDSWKNNNKLNSGSACCCSVQNTLFCVLLLGNVWLQICKSDSPVVFCGFESWCVMSNVVHRLRVFENRVLWIMFIPKGEEITGGWRNLHNWEICGMTLCQILI